ncbi:MAG TPA: carboxypeptidase-like regulatory domain-containing protein [Pyrinomonadaceae bacterium]|jgi:CSLREA domain-containing protein
MRFPKVLLSLYFVFCLSLAASAATFTVTKIADTNDGACDAADCSLREAIAAANAGADNDTVLFGEIFALAPQTIILSGTDLQINNNGTLTITGPMNRALTVSGNNQSRIFTNNTGAVTTITNLRLTGGNGVSTVQSGRGGGVYNNGGTLSLLFMTIEGNSAANGGGFNNAGTGSVMRVEFSAVSNNTATGAGGAMQNFSTSTLHLYNTTVNGNTCNSTLTGGGGIQANGTLTMSNVTFSGNNAAGGDGGAIYYNGSGLTMNNVTVAGNTATGGGAGGLHKSTSTLNANVRNSIFANNTGSASPDVSGAISSQGNNIIRTVGASTGWIMSDLQNVDPLLAPLGYYGGVTNNPRFYTHALLNTSPAVNAGNNCVTDLTCGTANPPSALNNDARGAARVGGVDIGAYEINNSYTAILPNAALNQPYNFILSPNTGGFNYTYSGSTPQGLLLDNTLTTATFSGSLMPVGTYNFNVHNSTNTFSLNYSLTVVANLSSVSVAGRFVTAAGAGIPNAIVSITANSTNVTRFARTNGFGYFRFDDVPNNQGYTVNVVSKQYQFQPVEITVTDNVTNLVLTAQ